MMSCFNPHFRKGSDRSFRGSSSGRQSFNPHFRKGSDTARLLHLYYAYSFNPHFRKGSDIRQDITFKLFTVSIHTSAREVTFLM